MTYFLLVCVIGLAGVLWQSHRKHEDALDSLRGDVAWMRAKLIDLHRAAKDKSA